MNVKITNEQHNLLCKLDFNEYLFGSHLHGIANENSDMDFIRVISDEFYKRFETLAIYFPNIHSFQYDDTENNSQYVWLTYRQFYQNLFSGDGNMVADVVLLSGKWENPLKLCYSYKIIKGYLGVAKRDLKMHGDNPKKRFHAWRSINMASLLINKELPTKEFIIAMSTQDLPTKEYLMELESTTRDKLNSILNDGLISHYPILEESDELVKTMVSCNNLIEFKYN